jgi:hypothetical protein
MKLVIAWLYYEILCTHWNLGSGRIFDNIIKYNAIEREISYFIESCYLLTNMLQGTCFIVNVYKWLWQMYIF